MSEQQYVVIIRALAIDGHIKEFRSLPMEYAAAASESIAYRREGIDSWVEEANVSDCLTRPATSKHATRLL